MSSSGDKSKTPFSSVLAFSFINSVGTGIVTSGIFFLTKSGYGFSDGANFVLGVLLGVTYIAGAMVAGWGTRFLRDRFGFSSRAILGGLMVVCALLCTIPYLAIRMQSGGEHGTKSAWPIWLIVATYSPLTGVLWPMVESYLSGGKSGDTLRRAVGTWNVVWSSALVFAYWGVARFIEKTPAEAILILGLSHIVGLALLATFAKEPAPHVHEDHAPHPPIYNQLLVAFRMLLPTGYLISSALAPYLSGLMPRLGVPAAWSTIVVSAWLLPRVIGFYVLDRASAWHGKWWPAILGAACLVVGFACCTVTGMIFGSHENGGDVATASVQPAAVALLCVGLAFFGVGMSIVYSGAIYYALEVGKAEVDAGGTHEALIGVGYTVGPLCGLAAWGLVQKGVMGLEQKDIDPLVLTTVGVVTAVVVAVTIRQTKKVTST
ncbi:MAG: hypothetical protein U0640_03630 [Phycisphaerales bacterium]